MEEFKRRMSAEVRRQEKLDMIEKKNFRREELPGKYMANCMGETMKNLRKNI